MTLEQKIKNGHVPLIFSFKLPLENLEGLKMPKEEGIEEWKRLDLTSILDPERATYTRIRTQNKKRKRTPEKSSFVYFYVANGGEDVNFVPQEHIIYPSNNKGYEWGRTIEASPNNRYVKIPPGSVEQWVCHNYKCGQQAKTKIRFLNHK